MRITHNLHFTGYRVEDFTKAAGPGRPFVTINMDHEDKLSQATLYLYDPAECDELIKAAAKAKRLLTGKPALEPFDVAAGADPFAIPANRIGERGEHPYPDAADPAADPFGPEAYKSHPAYCTCWDCKAEREEHSQATPMQRYDRQAHIAWHERTHPDADIWPRQPLTDDEALAAMADYEGKPSLVGRLVEDAHDDSPVPTVGKVVGQVDEDTVEVAWGVQRSAANPLTHHEPIDALRPARDGSGM